MTVLIAVDAVSNWTYLLSMYQFSITHTVQVDQNQTFACRFR